jgi:hypothetical protein
MIRILQTASRKEKRRHPGEKREPQDNLELSLHQNTERTERGKEERKWKNRKIGMKYRNN